MASSFYAQRKGEYVYDVTVSKDETVTLPRRYRARLTNAERIQTEAMRALDASFEAWRLEQIAKGVNDALSG
jgi:hypothetical protein